MMGKDKEEMIGVLTAMSIVAERLAKQLKKEKKDDEKISRSSEEAKEPCR